MSTIKTFKVSDWSDNFSVVLEVDLDKLTPELAEQINNFRGSAEDHLEAEDGDVVRAVIRLYGSHMIALLVEDGGAYLSPSRVPGLCEAWTKKMQEEEGWPGGDGTPHGALGIRLLQADVQIPGFDDLELSEVAP